MIRHCALILLSGMGVAIASTVAADEIRPPVGSRANPLLYEIPDSLLAEGVIDTTGEMAAFLVAGERIVRRDASGNTVIGRSGIDILDAGDVSELAPALGSTRMQVNSRGEALFSVRGAPERHAAVFLDGIPLAIPWDERTDLSMLALDAVGGIEARRGIHSVADGPHALAGRVDLKTQRLGRPGLRSRVGVAAGEANAWEARAALLMASPSLHWDGLLALSHRSSDGFLLPEAASGLLHQDPNRRTRQNSAREQSAALLSLRRVLPRSGELRGTLQWSAGEKGVAPEGHVSDARFWRYPDTRRLLGGVSAQVHLDTEQSWRLHGRYSADIFHQEIREFGDATYSDPPPAPGDDYEEDDDLTHSGRLALRRVWRNSRSLEVAADGRWTDHRETLVVGGPEERYAQRLRSFTAEWTEPVSEHWRLRLGGGYERASTPKTGDKDSKRATEAPVGLVALRRTFASAQLEARLSQRSRFPSLRESFSGALGRFELNPDLAPEEQTLAELDARWANSRLELSGGFFGSWIDGAIERVVSENDPSLYRRANVNQLRTLGSEFSINWSPPLRGFTVASRVAVMHARVKENGSYDRRAEDRPAFLGTSYISYSHASGVRLRLENLSVGSRYAVDPTAGDGLTSLAAQSSWNVRVSYLWVPTFLPQTELFARLRNVFDAQLLSQPGLPEPGRSLWAGVKLEFD
jgi:iron complex outermembrane receptor protein